MSAGLVVSLCDRTGNMVRPWAEAEYDAAVGARERSEAA